MRIMIDAVDDKPSGKMTKEQKLKLKLKEKDEQIRRLSAEMLT